MSRARAGTKPVPDIALPFADLQSIGKVYAFLDLEHPAVQWAVMRGILVSASHISDAQGFVSFMQAGMIYTGNNARIFNETIIEMVRETKFSDSCKSRMRGMYFFGSRTEALARIGDRDWPYYFEAENLVEFDLLCDDMPTVVDANWITFAQVDSRGRIDPRNIDWISNYWSGEPYNDNPTWEVITDGVAVIPDEQIRRKCNAELEKQFPDSIIQILMARIASEVGTRGGVLHPFLLRENDQKVILGYLLSDAEFHDREIIQRMAKHPDSAKLGKLMSENETWKSADLRPWFRHYELGIQNVDGVGSAQIPSVHENKAVSTNSWKPSQ